MNLIRNQLEDGFLQRIIETSMSDPSVILDIDDNHKMLLDDLVDSVTSEVGRAIVGLTVLQLSVKTICPEQDIRLHKGSATNTGFSWKEGISMRTIDKNFITPALRSYGLLSFNADGFMMTRSLAENYPYSKFYKASIRGN